LKSQVMVWEKVFMNPITKKVLYLGYAGAL
jgi:hypothetical protein